MPKILFNLLNPFSIRKQYNAVNKYAYSRNVNYINPPDGQIKPMPGNRQIQQSGSTASERSMNLLDKVGNVVPLQEEDNYVCRGNNRIVRINTNSADPANVTDVMQIAPGNKVGTITGRTTCASDGENVYFANGKDEAPLWYGKSLEQKFWQASAPNDVYTLEKATLEVAEALKPRLMLRQYRYGTWANGLHPTMTDVDPLNGNVDPGAAYTGFYRQNLGRTYQGTMLTGYDILKKNIITPPDKDESNYGNLGLKKYWFGLSLIYDGYQETVIHALRIFPPEDIPAAGNQEDDLLWQPSGDPVNQKKAYHFVEEDDPEVIDLWNGKSITKGDGVAETIFGANVPLSETRRVRVFHAGLGPKPLKAVQIEQDGVEWISGSGIDGFYLRLEFPDRRLLSDRVTGCKVYVQHTATEAIEDEEPGTGDWFLVQDISFLKDYAGTRTANFASIKAYESNHTVASPGNRIVSEFNYMGVNRGPYEQSTGLSAVYKSMDVRYGFCAEVQGRLVVADVSYPGAQENRVENDRELLISEYDRFAVFDYLFKRIRLKHKPTAIVGYAGDMLVFEEGHTYRIDMTTFEIREEWEGIGASGPESIASTDRGLFFANRQNIFWAFGNSVEAIGNEIWDIAEYPAEGYKNMKAGQTPTIAYNSVFDCAIVLWAKQDNSVAGAMYSPTIRDWVTHIAFDGTYPYKIFTAYNGKNYLIWAGMSAGHFIHELFTDLTALLNMLIEAKLTQIGNVKFVFHEFNIDLQNASVDPVINDPKPKMVITVNVKKEGRDPVFMGFPQGRIGDTTNGFKRFVWPNNNPFMEPVDPQEDPNDPNVEMVTEKWLTDVQFIIEITRPAANLSIKNIFAKVRPQRIESKTINV